MQYLGLTAFSERGNGFVNDMVVDIAVMSISSVSYTHLDVYKRQDFNDVTTTTMSTCLSLTKPRQVHGNLSDQGTACHNRF